MSGERPNEPTRQDVLQSWLEQHALELHTALPGRVESYDATTQTASVLPLIRAQVPRADGGFDYEDLPVVPSVPVLFPRSGVWFVAFPLEPGDTVQLLCNEAAIGHWRAGGGEVAHPGDLRRHHLAHAVAIPGLLVRSRALAHAPATAGGMVIGSDDPAGARITLKPDGTVEIVGGPAVDFVALAAKVDSALAAIRTAYNTHVHTGVTTGLGSSGTPATPLVAAASTAATRVKAT